MSNLKKILISFLNANVYYKRGFFIILSWYIVVHILKLEKNNLFLTNLYIFLDLPCIFSNSFDILAFTFIIGFTTIFIINKLKKIHFKNFLTKYKSNPLDIKLRDDIKQIWI